MGGTLDTILQQRLSGPAGTLDEPLHLGHQLLDRQSRRDRRDRQDGDSGWRRAGVRAPSADLLSRRDVHDPLLADA
ncbi:hypothetical protein [Agromyces flavus]|uniref:hypothetical protein n=1 Tax=Agromyces flavus TaxID=589382 RepID=UPI001561AA97|nr:hypothetical protein [Agromyces flavus]